MKPVMAAGLTPVGPLLQAFFIDYLYGQKRASARTVESYRDTFRLLLQFLRQTTEKEPSTLHTLDLDAPAILSFLDHLECQRNNQAQSRNVRLAAVHSFFRMVAIRDPGSVGVATRVLAPEPVCRRLRDFRDLRFSLEPRVSRSSRAREERSERFLSGRRQAAPCEHGLRN